ncbi:formylglycine-generating enzyme family protein [Pelagicoccus mobilis]|uniref:Formylglycine-generating enzyme family protein n=1 Tax=Pelagicoccus mobilis TaxID=415221 RepID=A0A934RXW2_9BACT|nr:formylglycine-generating enzyme family protein [Pelagicoccus mobilis]MBK1878777.1 formylglycine-generating enzyme family protein [Pelagicoccus mobilis]
MVNSRLVYHFSVSFLHSFQINKAPFTVIAGACFLHWPAHSGTDENPTYHYIGSDVEITDPASPIIAKFNLRGDLETSFSPIPEKKHTFVQISVNSMDWEIVDPSTYEHDDTTLSVQIHPKEKATFLRLLSYEQLSLKDQFSELPAGTFTMGAPDNQVEGYSEPLHEATITKPFSICTTEVTWGIWKAVRSRASLHNYDDLQEGWSGSWPGKGDDHPVTTIDWWSAIKWCNLRSEIEGKVPVYYNSSELRWQNVLRNGSQSVFVNWDANGYRLPTEAEWEYACRAGTTTAFYTGPITHPDAKPIDPNLDRAGWYGGNSGTRSHAVGLKEANAWGLYDTHGNVWEWCFDYYGHYNIDNKIDYKGPESGNARVIKGGSWSFIAANCRSSFRSAAYPGGRGGNGLGFRLVHTDSTTE